MKLKNYHKDVIATFLMLLAPYWAFLIDRDYSILAPESIILGEAGGLWIELRPESEP